MSDPASGFFEGAPRLHYLEWNPRRRRTLVCLHGNSANAWWWQPMAEALGELDFRILALDLRGHGESDWVRPPAYLPTDYAADVARFLRGMALADPVVIGHSMGGVCALALVVNYPNLVRAAVVVDVAVTSSQRRNRYLQRLRALPTVTYPDLETAKARFRLMPNEGAIAATTIAMIAEKSLGRTDTGRYTMKFDRESFFGGDGLDVVDAIRRVRIPLLLVRGERSRIMTAEAAERAAASNPVARLVTIAGAHHHVLLERPASLASTVREFVTGLV
jgi:pimeloyl-ACP methyl ester carboxylesterase